MTHWGPTYYEMTHQPTAEELEEQAASKRRQEAFPNVSFTDLNKDRVVHQWALRRIKDGKIVTMLDEDGPYNFGPMGHCPDGYEVVTRTLWPEPWENPNL